MTTVDKDEHKIAIVGLGGCFPDAETVSEYWQNILAGHVAIDTMPEHRLDAAYFSEDRSQPDLTYSRLGACIKKVRFDPKRFRIPPRTLQAIDDVQKLALTAVADALEDAGLQVFEGRGEGQAFDRSRTAVILGNSMGGEAEIRTGLRAYFPQMLKALAATPAWDALGTSQRVELREQFETQFKEFLPKITEDSMPGELSNCITGRVANAFDFRGPNYTTDAACAASMAALNTAVLGLRMKQFDTAIVGGADSSMDPPTFVKFSKIGALSARHSVPFDAEADGFVMGEGVGVLILKRLSDAQRDGNRIYAVVRGVGSSSDGRGKGLTAPNPRGQRMAVERAWADAGVDLKTAGLFEAHGTSTVVGDSTELKVLTELLSQAANNTPQAIPVGSVKSMIGHLKSAAGAASLIKTALALHHGVLPPSAGFKNPTESSPLHDGFLRVSDKASTWTQCVAERRAGVSAFGFGGTNFHAVLEGYDAAASTEPQHASGSGMGSDNSAPKATPMAAKGSTQGIGGEMKAVTTIDRKSLLAQIQQLFAEKTGYDVADLDPGYSLEADLGIDTVKQAEIFSLLREQHGLGEDENFLLSDVSTLNAVVDYVAQQTSGATISSHPTTSPAPTNIAQPQVATMPVTLPQLSTRVMVFGGKDAKQVVAEAARLAEQADSLDTLEQLGAKSLAGAVWRLAFVAADLAEAKQKIDDAGRRRSRMLAARGIFLHESQWFTSESLVFGFPGQGSQSLQMMSELAKQFPIVAQTFAEADEILEPLIGGKLTSFVWPQGEFDIEAATLRLRQTDICQPGMLTADVAMLRLLQQHGLTPGRVVGHSLGEYAACVAAGVLSFKDALYAVSARGQGMSEVAFEKDVGKMASVAAECTQVDDMLKDIEGYVISANKNCRSQTVIAGESTALEKAIEKFKAAGVQAFELPVSHAFHSEIVAPASAPLNKVLKKLDVQAPKLPISSNVTAEYYPADPEAIVALLTQQMAAPVEFISQIKRLYADGVRVFVEVGPKRAITGFVRNILEGEPHLAVATNHPKKSEVLVFQEALAALAAVGMDLQPASQAAVVEQHVEAPVVHSTPAADQRPEPSEKYVPADDAVVVSGLSVLMPTAEPVIALDEDPYAALLRGDNCIEALDESVCQAIVDKKIVRLQKNSGQFCAIETLAESLQVAARVGEVDIVEQYGIDANLADALDRTSRMAIAVGIDALRDAGLPLIHHYRTTSTGKRLPDRWGLPLALSEQTGVVVASAFPGVDRLIEDVTSQASAAAAKEAAVQLQQVLEKQIQAAKTPEHAAELQAAFADILADLQSKADAYTFNRKFLFRILSMAHAQLAQVILAQGPNTQVNAACASGVQGVAVGMDWLRLGRCEKVLVVSVDDTTHETNLPWIGAGFLATGAATTEADPQKAAVPFGRTRNGLILGAGASAFVLEHQAAVAARGMQPVCEILGADISNSAFHGTRLDAAFISERMAKFCQALQNTLQRDAKQLAQDAFFVSHETYTPARGGSAAAEVDALRRSFGDSVGHVLIANSKGFTGHPMGATIEDVVAIKGLQRQVLPPVANLDDVDPDFKDLQFSNGSAIQRDIAIRFAAGFGSQVALAAYRRCATQSARLLSETQYHQWLNRIVPEADKGLEVVQRRLRVAEKQGVQVSQLGIPSLQPVDGTAVSVFEPSQQQPVVVPTPESVATQVVAPVASQISLNKNDVVQQLQALFAEQTGYDLDDLDPEHALEADLGIDTVKQAEIFSLLREQYTLAQDDAFSLADHQTLNLIADYVVAKSGAAVQPSTVPVVVPETPASAPVETVAKPEVAKASLDKNNVVQQLQALFAEQTGYDLDDLDPEHALEADLGIDTVKQAEIFSLLREQYTLAQDDEFSLADHQTLNLIADYVVAKSGAAVQPSTAPVVVPETPAPAPVAAVAKPEAAKSSLDKTDVVQQLQTLFAEQTGYDLEDLDPEHALEADLGIDTVKQAEIFSLLREQYTLAQDDEFSLADHQTLNLIADYVVNQSGTATVVVDKEIPAPVVAAPIKIHDFQGFTAQHVGLVPVVVKIGAPLDWSKRQVLVVGHQAAALESIQRVLEQRGATVRPWLKNVQSSATNRREEFAAKLKEVDDVVVWLSQDIDVQVPEFFALAQAFVARGATQKRLVALSGFGTGFGFAATEAPIATAVAGAVAGFCKSIDKELPGSVCRVIDVSLGDDVSQQDIGAALDACCDGDGVEWTRVQGRWFAPERMPIDIANTAALNSKAGSVVMATGGARGITFAVLKKMAEQTPFTCILVGRSAPLRVVDSPLNGLDAAAQKALARKTLSESQERVTPLDVRQWLGGFERRAEVADNITQLETLGVTVHWISCDVGQESSLQTALQQIQQQFPAIDVLIHGAGFEESKALIEKTPESLRKTWDPKTRAAIVMQSALQPRRLVTFGSIAGRFGNVGQADYAAANEALAAMSRGPESRWLNIDWTAWSDVGMATRGSVQQVMEQMGIDMLPAQIGAQIGANLVMSQVCGDVVVAGSLGAFAAVSSILPEASEAVQTPWFDWRQVESDHVVYTRTLSPTLDAGLNDHRIDGVAVLPGVIGIELMHAAARDWSGEEITALENINFERPLKFFHDKAVQVHVQVERVNAQRLKAGVFTLFQAPSGKLMRHDHFHAQLCMGGQRSAPKLMPMLELPRKVQVGQDEIYQRYFHGPEFQILPGIDVLGDNGVELDAQYHDPSTWVSGVCAQDFVTQPYLRELAFQAAGMWEMIELGRLALPRAISHLELHQPIAVEQAVSCHVRHVSTDNDGTEFDIWIRSQDGTVCDVMQGYMTTALRVLQPAERFEPVRPAGQAPCWLSLQTEHVKRFLGGEQEVLLSKYLAESEIQAFSKLQAEKRRIEWLAGRLVAKKIVREWLFHDDGSIVPYHALNVQNDAQGAPFVQMVGSSTILPRISISHSGPVAVAMLVADDLCENPGIDIEHIESRAEGFMRDYFTDAERQQIVNSPMPDQLITSFWAVKEATLKSLGIGARLDLRQVQVRTTATGEWQVQLHAAAASSALGERFDVTALRVEVENLAGDMVVARVWAPIRDITQSQISTEISPEQKQFIHPSR